MTTTHILFDLYGTLADSSRMPPCYARGLGQVMAARYGGAADAWARANRAIYADWDSYYADLDLTGDHGMDDLREGEIRTTRALFRLTGAELPPAAEIATLARELPYEATRHCNVLYADVRPVLQRLRDAGYILGVASHATVPQIRGTLEGGNILPLFNGPLIGPDVAGRFVKDAAFYRSAGLEPASCLVVDDQEDGVSGARMAGMRPYFLARDERPVPAGVPVLRGGLRPLLTHLIP